MTDVLRLVFQKQYECVRHSTRIVVPSAPMRETIRRCYPWCPTEKIVVLPWGDVSTSTASVAAVCDRRSAVAQDDSALILARGRGVTAAKRRYSIDDNEFVIMTLSRLSPEKGIERLLAALSRVETSGRRLRVFICGGPAYMKGRAYERKLRRLAARLDGVHVEFTGHVTGAQKAALLQRADLFVSPSRHESYGLTIAEASAAGCCVISHNHYGASGQVVDCSDPAALAAAISAALAEGHTHKNTTTPPPSRAAEELAALLVATAECPAPATL